MTELDQLDQLEAEIAGAVAAARAAGGPAAARVRLQRRVAALQHARQLYLGARNRALQACAQTEDRLATVDRTLQQLRTDLAEAERRLAGMPDVYDPRPALRDNLARAEQEQASLTLKLAEERAALAAVAPYWPPEEQFEPPTETVFVFGQPHYYRGSGEEVRQDGSPLPSQEG